MTSESWLLDEEEAALVHAHRASKKPQFTPTTMSAYTGQVRDQYFSRIYNLAKSILEDIEKEDYCDDNDNAQYCYEAVMEILAIDRTEEMWKYLNSLVR